MRSKIIIIEVFCVFLMIFASVFFGLVLQHDYGVLDISVSSNVNYVFDNSSNIDVIVSYCNSSGDISDKIFCVRNITESFFSYNVTNDTVVLSFSDLVTRGGDCLNWNNYWNDIASRMGFSVNPVLFRINDTHSHIMSIYSNNEGYCAVDQLNVNCFNYK